MDGGARKTRNPADQLAIEQERASLALDAARMGEFEWEIDEDRFIVSERMAAITGVPAARASIATSELVSGARVGCSRHFARRSSRHVRIFESGPRNS